MMLCNGQLDDRGIIVSDSEQAVDHDSCTNNATP